MSKAQSGPKMAEAVSWAQLGTRSQAVASVRVATLGPPDVFPQGGCKGTGRKAARCRTPGSICERRLLANFCSTLSPKRSSAASSK